MLFLLLVIFMVVSLGVLIYISAKEKETSRSTMIHLSVAMILILAAAFILYVFKPSHPMRFASLIAYGMSGVVMSVGAIDKMTWKSRDTFILVGFVLLASVVGGFFTDNPHSVIRPVAVMSSLGCLVMGSTLLCKGKSVTGVLLFLMAILAYLDTLFLNHDFLFILIFVKIVVIDMVSATAIYFDIREKKSAAQDKGK